MRVGFILDGGRETDGRPRAISHGEKVLGQELVIVRLNAQAMRSLATEIEIALAADGDA